MTMTPLAPRAPYIDVLAASLRTCMDSMSYGLTPVRLPFGPGWMGKPSTTYSGALFPWSDVLPRMRTAMPPSAVRVIQTPGTLAMRAFSMGSLPVERLMSSDVTGFSGSAASPLSSPLAVFPCAHPERTPTSRPKRNTTDLENGGIGVGVEISGRYAGRAGTRDCIRICAGSGQRHSRAAKMQPEKVHHPRESQSPEVWPGGKERIPAFAGVESTGYSLSGKSTENRCRTG